MKKILLISRAFYPDISPRSFRTTELVKEFCRQGHDVTLMTVGLDDERLELAREYGFALIDLGPVRWKRVQLAKSGIRRLWTRFLKRTTHLLFQYPDIELMFKVRNRVRREAGYDLLISIAVPHSIHWGVAWSRSERHRIATTWIADCGDPFMGQENDTFRPLFYFGYLEKWFCRKADYISVPVEGARDAYYPEFRNKIVVIPQGFDFDAVPRYEGEIRHQVPTFAYAGSFIPGRRDPRPLLSFLHSLDADFRFHLYSRQNHLIKNLADASKGKVILHDIIPREDLLYELSKMDFLVNLENVGERQTPSKLIDYAIIDRPILSLDSSNLDFSKIRAFLYGDYSDQYDQVDIDHYRIDKVGYSFLQCHEQHQSAMDKS
jgi:hypothetical protein